VYIWQGRNDDALAALERSIELNPSLGLASAARSFQSLASGAFERAKDLLRIAMRLRIGDRLLGACLPAKVLADLHLGNDGDALDTAHWAARLQPRFWLAGQALAASLARNDQREAADEVLALRRDYAGLTAGEFAAWVPLPGSPPRGDGGESARTGGLAVGRQTASPPRSGDGPIAAVPAVGYCCAVVGSIILPMSVILVAGNPLISACFRITASSLAR